MKKGLILISLVLICRFTFSQDIIESNNRFSFDIFKKLKSSNENLIFSPASVTSAIAMTYIGAKNNTFDEISNTFYFNKNQEEFSKGYIKLIDINFKKNSDIKFYNANSLWIQEDLELNQQFLDINKQYFSSSTQFTNFIKDPEKSRISINQWVEKNTNNKISNLLKPSSIDKSTRLVLVNALYFKGSWKKEFDKKKNTEENFQIGKKDFITTTFMNTGINSWYYEDKYSQIIDIPYKDDKISIMIILPKSYKKLKKLEKELNYDYYINYSTNKEKRRINLSLPKFKLESEFDLNKTLSELGIKDAFTGNADFSGITIDEKLYISNVVHKANIQVDEEGTEAAAATAVVMRKTSVLLETIDFKVNKPFIYFIRNNETDCIYFMGKVINPNN